MNDIGGYISAADAERYRKIRVIAFESVEADNDTDDKAILTPSEAKARRPLPKEEVDWPELIDVRNGVLTAIEDSESDSSDSQLKKKIRDSLGPSPNKNRPSPIEDDKDLFEDNSDEKAVIRVYFSETAGARVPHWVDIDNINPKKYRVFDEYILVVYEPQDFIIDDDEDYNDW